MKYTWLVKYGAPWIMHLCKTNSGRERLHMCVCVGQCRGKERKTKSHANSREKQILTQTLCCRTSESLLKTPKHAKGFPKGLASLHNFQFLLYAPETISLHITFQRPIVNVRKKGKRWKAVGGMGMTKPEIRDGPGSIQEGRAWG